MTEKESLNFIATTRFQELKLLHGLHPLGNDIEVHVPGHRNHRHRDRRVIAVADNIAHEGLIDLDPLDWKSLELTQAGVAGTKIVDAQFHPQVLELGEDADGAFHIAREQAPGDLKLELARAELRLLNRTRDQRHELRLHKLHGRNIHCDTVDGDADVNPASELFASRSAAPTHRWG
jgi:hypothetical protein